MAQLVATIALLALAAPAALPSQPAQRSPGARAQPARPAAIPEPQEEELLKAPVEIVLPAQPEKRAKAPSSSTAKPKLAAPTAQHPPAPPPPAAAAAQQELPSEAEILAAATGRIADARPGYALVQQKCGRCHPMEKALDASFAPGDWDPYIKRKLRRHGTGISAEQAEEIVRFLSTWSAQRSEK